MKLMRMALTGSLLLVLAACGNNSPVTDPPQNPNTPNNPSGPTLPGLPGLPGGPTGPTTPVGNGISGTVTAPAGASASGTIVIVCAQSDTECNSASTTTADAAGAYSFTDLQATPYIVVAIRDIDGNQDLNAGDYVGFYSTDGANPATVTPPATGVNITMQVVGDSNGPNTPPETPGTEGGSITGTLLPPGTVTGASAAFTCYLTEDQNNPCDDNLSNFVELAAGSGFAYSVDNLSAGQYVVVGYSDTDGNGSIEDANDYVGIYPSSDAPALVSPPATGIDITMITNTEFGALSVQSTTETVRVLSAARVASTEYMLKQQLEQALRTLH